MKQIIENMKSGNMKIANHRYCSKWQKSFLLFSHNHAYGEENISDSQILDAIEN